MRKIRKSATKIYKLFSIVIILFFSTTAFALQGSVGAHDPSSIVKDGNTYWIFTTADGIGAKYSTDLVKWTDGKSPYTKTIWPSWITLYAKAFSGSFWAPECIYMNGKYYLYYAAAGSGECCIGLVTSPSLNNPEWTDEGVVIWSVAANDNTNGIDPDVFFDADGKLWLSYGSWLGGIRMVELDKTTGRPFDFINQTKYNPCNLYDAENSQVVQHGGYYYMFVNRGLCCRDAASTYYIQVGRSEYPNYGYSGWRTILGTSGSFIGPGGLGYFNEDTTEWATFHYYDGNLNGWPTLAIGKFEWKDGWPSVNLNWIENGTNKITSVNSGLVWDDWGCTGDVFEPIVQGTWNNELCQKWDFTQLDNGYYKITCALGGLSADALGCTPDNGTKMNLYSYWGGGCQIWDVERTNTGNYVISSKFGNRVVEVPGDFLTVGKQLSLYDYNGNMNQLWTISTTSTINTQTTEIETLGDNIQILPNPISDGQFVVNLGRMSYADGLVLKIFNIQGKLMYKQTFENCSDKINLSVSLKSGVYLLSIQNPKETATEKLYVR
ncbi:MAG TPA: family 43 glycosylhydrolase [Prolixibacteraceae bacterium]|nr:family 43 glycosylhydrolase [Prolixibacteraceae bacterium]